MLNLLSFLFWRPAATSVRVGLARNCFCLVAVAFAIGAGGAGTASAAGLSSESLGVDGTIVEVNGQKVLPSDISMASSSGLGLVRIGALSGQNIDASVASAAEAHLRVYAVLGLSTQLTPSAAATAMAQYVTTFAEHYGPGGTFWAQNPQLPYLPINSYEIGNEPNLPLLYVVDSTHLHWSDPAAYAQVYEAARTALHQVDPTGVAVVGGLADSAVSSAPAVDVQTDEEWLAALTPGAVDAVGYHPYTFDVSSALMQPDTEALRRWMDANGMSHVPIDVNEIGACDDTPGTTPNPSCTPAISISSSDWGTLADNYTEWALCSTAVGVENVLPLYWGDTPTTDAWDFLPFVTGEGVLTPYGQDFLNEAHVLTTDGCQLANSSAPVLTGDPVVGQTMSVSAGSWSSPSGYALSYQWQRCDTSGQNCEPISGATSADYELQSADARSTLVALVTATNSAGSVSAWSAATSLVSVPAPLPTISNSPAVSDPPPTGGSSAAGGGGNADSLPLVKLKLAGVRAHGNRLTLTVVLTSGTGRITVAASKGHHRVALSLTAHKHRNTLLTFSGKLTRGRWTVTVTCHPAPGFAASSPEQRTVKLSG